MTYSTIVFKTHFKNIRAENKAVLVENIIHYVLTFLFTSFGLHNMKRDHELFC